MLNIGLLLMICFCPRLQATQHYDDKHIETASFWNYLTSPKIGPKEETPLILASELIENDAYMSDEDKLGNLVALNDAEGIGAWIKEKKSLAIGIPTAKDLRIQNESYRGPVPALIAALFMVSPDTTEQESAYQVFMLILNGLSPKEVSQAINKKMNLDDCINPNELFIHLRDGDGNTALHKAIMLNNATQNPNHKKSLATLIKIFHDIDVRSSYVKNHKEQMPLSLDMEGIITSIKIDCALTVVLKRKRRCCSF